MLINPFNDGLDVIEGTPFLQERRLGQFIGARVHHGDPRRLWTIQGFLLPSRKRAIRGIRASLQDQKGFVTFCNQRDLEVLLGLGLPGSPCYWLGRKYVSPGDEDWVGLHAAEDDLLDDLYERELLTRCDYPLLPEGTTVGRYVHLETGRDVEETWMLLRDYDPETGLCPDPRYETVARRWVRVERVNVIWDLMKS